MQNYAEEKCSAFSNKGEPLISLLMQKRKKIQSSSAPIMRMCVCACDSAWIGIGGTSVVGDGFASKEGAGGNGRTKQIGRKQDYLTNFSLLPYSFLTV